MVWRRSPKDPLSDIDPATIGPSRRSDVEAALGWHRRFSAIVDRAPAGPVRDRLGAMAPEVESAVRGVYQAARRTDAREATLEDLRPDAVTARLKDARRDLQRAIDDGRPTEDLERVAASLDRQLGSIHTVWDALDRAAADLHTLQLRLGEIVALAGAVTAHVPEVATDELGDVRDELVALRASLEELSA